MIRLLDRMALGATLIAPLFLLHSRSLAEVMIATTAISFLLRSALAHDWSWLRAGWVPFAGAWWVWLVICSIPGIGTGGAHALGEALAVLRFLVFAAALENCVLRELWARVWLGRIVSIAALYIGLQALLQFATGRNLFGQPPAPDGALTGPYGKERAGPEFSRLMFPALLPAAWRLVGRDGIAPKLAAAILTFGTVAVSVLFGQRMPLVLTGFGLLVSGLLLKRLRALVLAACVAGLALTAATAVISPPTFHRLVTKFSAQLEHFPSSHYGLIAARAVTMGEQNPWTGLGFDGFRDDCADPRYFRGWLGGDGGGATICVQHPHNHYLQALTSGGYPGLVLFSAMVLAWLVTLGRGLWRAPDPLRVGLFVAVLVQEWPIASASDFVSMTLGGWFFLLLGFGLAEARAARTAPARAVVAPPGAAYMVPDGRTVSE